MTLDQGAERGAIPGGGTPGELRVAGRRSASIAKSIPHEVARTGSTPQDGLYCEPARPKLEIRADRAGDYRASRRRACRHSISVLTASVTSASSASNEAIAKAAAN